MSLSKQIWETQQEMERTQSEYSHEGSIGLQKREHDRTVAEWEQLWAERERRYYERQKSLGVHVNYSGK